MSSIADKINEKFSVHGSNITDAINQITNAYGSNITDAIDNVTPGSGSDGSGESTIDLWPAAGEYTDEASSLNAKVFAIKDIRSFGPYSSAADYYEHDFDTDYATFANDPLNSEQMKVVRTLGFSEVVLKKLLANSTYFCGSEMLGSVESTFAGYGFEQISLDGSGFSDNDGSMSKFMSIDLGDGSGPVYWLLCEVWRADNSDLPITNGWYQYLDYRSDMTRKTRLTANNVAHLYDEYVDEITAETVQVDLYKFYIPVRVYQFLGQYDRYPEYCGYKIQLDENEVPVIVLFGDIEAGK